MKKETLTYQDILNLFKETDRKMQETHQSILELRNSQAQTDKQLAQTDKQLAQTDKQLAQTDKQLAQTDKQIKELGIQIGGLGNRFGKFTEDLFYNSLSKLMKEKFGVQFFEPNRSREKGDSSIEIDAMGIVNGSINAVYLTEIKTKYNKKAIEQLTTIIKKFDSFYPELSDKKKFGIIAVPHLKEEQLKEILKAGFYPATLKNDLVVIDTPKNFKAKEF